MTAAPPPLDGAGRSALLIDDDDVFRERMAEALRRRGFEVSTAPDCATAISTGKRLHPDFAIVDMRMPDGSGQDVVDGLVSHCPDTRIVILTGYGSIASAVDAIHRGAHHYLSKPIDADELTAALLRVEGEGVPLVAPESATPSLARAEWEHIQRVLADAGGNVSEAARRLGIARRTLQLKLKKYPPRT